MNDVIAAAAELRLGEKRGRLTKNLIGALELAVLAL
jgi:hypothetical protein